MLNSYNWNYHHFCKKEDFIISYNEIDSMFTYHHYYLYLLVHCKNQEMMKIKLGKGRK